MPFFSRLASRSRAREEAAAQTEQAVAQGSPPLPELEEMTQNLMRDMQAPAQDEDDQEPQTGNNTQTIANFVVERRSCEYEEYLCRVLGF